MNKYLMICLLSLFLVMMVPVKVMAGTVITGDESLGGFSKLIDDYYNSISPDEDVVAEWIEWRLLVQDKINTNEIEVLRRCVEAEATGGTLEQKINVASCIMNRVIGDEWPDTITDVVFQVIEKSYQFAVIKDKRYYKVNITSSTIDACDYVLTNGSTHDATFFCTRTCNSANGGWHDRNLKFLFYDGEHNYYRPRGRGDDVG